MIKDFTEYRSVVGDDVIANVFKKARIIYGRHIVNINSTYFGGGVAEMLTSLIPAINDVGIDTGWRILYGTPDFFGVTKKFHNALQGEELHLSDIKKEIYTKGNEYFSRYTHLHHDAVIIHDPQPLPLINYYKKDQPWIWRCHIDLSNPNEELWEYLKEFLIRYDLMIVSHEDYKRPDLPIEQKIIHPAINPLSSKNKDLTDEDIEKYLEKFNIPTDKPLITQVSRFDKWKDPLGVVEIFKEVRKEVDCRLVLCGSMATDDPEGKEIYDKVRDATRELSDNGDIILITAEHNILVNILQRASSVVIQKSLREGFGLVVTEALWKETPVVGSRVGGIPLQIIDGETGYLLEPHDIEGMAEKVVYLLQNKDKRREMGKKGREHVKKNFLITRLVEDYINLINEVSGRRRSR